MNTLGQRLLYARKQKGYTQESLANLIGVSRGVIYNLEKDKSSPQEIVVNAICQALRINRHWLLSGMGEMKTDGEPTRKEKTLAELYQVAKELSTKEQLFLLEVAQAVKRCLAEEDEGI